MPDTVFVKVTSAFAAAGVLHAAGTIVEVSESLAVNLLHRGKVELATDLDAPAPDADAPDADPAAEPDTKPADKPARK